MSSNTLLSFGYMYSYSGTTAQSYININSYYPYYNVPCESSSSGSTTLVNSGICVLEVILYLQQSNPLFFNISPGGSDNYLNATGNFELEMLYAYPNTAPSYINTLTNYTYNNYPIMNSNFIYGILKASNYINGYTAYNTNFGSLTILTL